jgi:hypothetical protein
VAVLDGPDGFCTRHKSGAEGERSLGLIVISGQGVKAIMHQHIFQVKTMLLRVVGSREALSKRLYRQMVLIATSKRSNRSSWLVVSLR